MNRVFLIGNLCDDPQAYTTQSGVTRSTLRLAVQRRMKNADGKHDTDFLTVIVWRQAADFCNKYLSKGRKIAVEGSIQVRSYKAQDGSQRYVTEIIADHIEALGSLSDRQEEKPEAPANQFVEVEDDQLPFD